MEKEKKEGEGEARTKYAKDRSLYLEIIMFTFGALEMYDLTNVFSDIIYFMLYNMNALGYDV